jgi:hypothetical protein
MFRSNNVAFGGKTEGSSEGVALIPSSLAQH